MGCLASNARNSRLKAGMSSGLRLVTRLPSTTTSRSTHVPPALAMSVCSEGQLVSVRPRTRSAETSSHGACQMTASGFFAPSISLMKLCASGTVRMESAFSVPPGRTNAS